MRNKVPFFPKPVQLQTVLLLLMAVIIVVFWFWLQESREEDGYSIYKVAILWILSLIFFLWLGNLGIYWFIQKRYSWESAFNQRFFLQLILSLAFSLACINVTYLVFKNNFTNLPPDQNQLILLNIYGLLFIIPILSLQFGFLFMHKWKKAIVEQEKLKKEQIQSELIALKSHLDPHFLFNNLNILSSLIHADNYPAQDYLDRFAEVYRYVLKNRDMELVSLKEELQFIDSYCFLLNRRFSEGLEVRINVPNRSKELQLPPLSLQMVLENALKHNKLSEKKPLIVDIWVSDKNRISIRNNLQVRKIPDHEKTGFGLENIKRRYWLIARKKIKVESLGKNFTVTLPLIQQQTKYEYIDH